jgi:hypothetical protein
VREAQNGVVLRETIGHDHVERRGTVRGTHVHCFLTLFISEDFAGELFSLDAYVGDIGALVASLPYGLLAVRY